VSHYSWPADWHKKDPVAWAICGSDGVLRSISNTEEFAWRQFLHLDRQPMAVDELKRAFKAIGFRAIPFLLVPRDGEPPPFTLGDGGFSSEVEGNTLHEFKEPGTETRES
jgi:hypothetical protein